MVWNSVICGGLEFGYGEPFECTLGEEVVHGSLTYFGIDGVLDFLPSGTKECRFLVLVGFFGVTVVVTDRTIVDFDFVIIVFGEKGLVNTLWSNNVKLCCCLIRYLTKHTERI